MKHEARSYLKSNSYRDKNKKETISKSSFNQVLTHVGGIYEGVQLWHIRSAFDLGLDNYEEHLRGMLVYDQYGNGCLDPK